MQPLRNLMHSKYQQYSECVIIEKYKYLNLVVDITTIVLSATYNYTLIFDRMQPIIGLFIMR